MFQRGGIYIMMNNLKLRKVNTLADAVNVYCELNVFDLSNNIESLDNIDIQNIIKDIEDDMDILTENLNMKNLDKYIFYEDKFVEDINLLISMM